MASKSREYWLIEGISISRFFMLELQFLEHKKVEMLFNYSNFIEKIRENRATVVIKKSKYVVSKSNNGNVKWIMVKYLGLISNFLEIELDIIERTFYNGL